MTSLAFLPAGGDALLVDTGSLDRALALLDRLRAAQPLGLVELVPAARTLLLRFDPFLTDGATLQAVVAGLDLTDSAARSGQDIDIPVHYDGEDLGELAEMLGLSVPALIAKHEAADFTVAFTGFAPGFAYLTCADTGLHVPRRKSPRVRIPAGSVALAGEFGGVYPSDSPGGWQILGRTPVPMWDLRRPRPALLAPGDRVRFRDIAKGATVPVSLPDSAPQVMDGPITITRADRPALMQDLGRAGQAAQGVSRAGAMDRAAFVAVNRLLGNTRNAPALEISFGGFGLTTTAPLTLALTGAPCAITIRRQDGSKITMPHASAFALDAGETLILAAPKSGIYSYLGLRGGFAPELVMGSASRDSLAKLGPAPLEAGQRLNIGTALQGATTSLPAPARLPKAGDTVVLDVILGPRDDWFTTQGVATLREQDWLVTPESSRTGKRLAGAAALERRDPAVELPSEATVAGSIQVPHSGQPVLFLADHPLTGGYPVIAVVAPHHLDLAAQIPPGAKIRFRPVSLSGPEFKG